MPIFAVSSKKLQLLPSYNPISWVTGPILSCQPILGKSVEPTFIPQSGENGSKMAIDGLGGLGYQSRCRRAVVYVVSEVGAQTGSRFEKPEVVFPVQEMDRNGQICIVAGLRGGGIPVLDAFRTAGPPRVVSGVGSRRGCRGAARARRGRRVLSPPRDGGGFRSGATTPTTLSVDL